MSLSELKKSATAAELCLIDKVIALSSDEKVENYIAEFEKHLTIEIHRTRLAEYEKADVIRAIRSAHEKAKQST